MQGLPDLREPSEATEPRGGLDARHGTLASHYTTAFVIMIVAFVCNELVRPVAPSHFVDGTGAPAAPVEEGVSR